MKPTFRTLPEWQPHTRRLQIVMLSIMSIFIVLFLCGHAPSPYLTQFALPSVSNNPLADEYRLIYAKQMSLPVSQRRYLIFDLESQSLGWGNRLEGTTGAFYVAVQTGRIFVIRNHRLWETVFETDPAAPNRWDYHKDDIALADASPLRLDDARFGTFELTSPGHWESQILRNASVVFASTALTRPMVYSQQIFHSEKGFYTHMGLSLSYLTSFPSEQMRDGLLRARQRFNMSGRAETLVIVQMRTMFDDTDNYQRAMLAPKQAAFWTCVAGALEGVTPDKTEILFTTDEPALNPLAVDLLGRYGRVLVSDGPVVHTSSAQNGEFPDPIADWWLMGQADRLLCTGTSFCHTAVWRSRSHPVPHFWILFNLYSTWKPICRLIDA